MLEFIQSENKWLTVSLGAALVAAAFAIDASRRRGLPTDRRILAAMNVGFGVTIGGMAFGHLLAVTTKLVLGTLEGSAVLFYGIGALLAVPSWWVIAHTRRILDPASDHSQRTLLLNAGTVAALLVLGPFNIPLAVPGLFNIGFLKLRRPIVANAIVGAAVVFYVALFVGSMIFWASGMTFEQFSGME